ncbi:MAG: PSD1 and planctomycete cytochrome C domain-containing protein [Planctomycetes bacterium]|nr:PSD1 and planctomycete cytochrome C domain-containing protein [Planctomycetota bacterium]
MNSAQLQIQLFAILLLACVLCGSAHADEPANEFDFAHRVVPILKQHCFECHGGHRHEGDFSINTREAIVDSSSAIPGDAANSYLIEMVTTSDAETRMPKEKPPLSEADVKTLREWIDAGVPWEAGFTFAPQDYEPPLRPRRPELPPPAGGRTNPIDRILDAYLTEHGVKRPAPLDDSTFARRAYLDIVGLLPTPDQLHAFLQNGRGLAHFADSSEQNVPVPFSSGGSGIDARREELIDSLLADNRAYTEHWLTFWNDLLRNDYQGTGYIEGGRKQISGWLYRALERNMPFDEFVRELISPTPDSEGFIYGITWRGNVNASQKREVQFAQNVSQVFLGMNMKCASCHDSFIDRWTLAETYGLAAITADAPLELYRCDKPTGKTAEAAWMFPELGQIDPKTPREERLRQLAALMTHADNGRISRTIVNRLWHRLMGRGIVHPVDAMQTEPWNADLLDFLATYLADNHFDLKSVIRLIVTSHAYQSQAIALDEQPGGPEFVFTGPIAKRMTAEQFVDALWQITDTGPREPHGSVAAFLTADEKKHHATYRASMVNSDLLMRSLGRPNREQVVTDRPAMLTTLQALDLSNSPLLAATLHRGAEGVLNRFAGQEPGAIVEWLYESALSRPPTSDERAIAVDVLGSPPTAQGVEDLLWIVFILPEFQIIR